MAKALSNALGYLRIALFVALIATLSACGTVPYLIRDEETLKSVNLGEDEGFLVARVYTDFSGIDTPHKLMERLDVPESIILEFKESGAGVFSSPQELRKFSTWEPLLVIKVPAATYRWDGLDFRTYTYDAGTGQAAFEIQAGSFNYIGDLHIEITEDAEGSFFATVSSEDNYAEIGRELETLFQASVEDYHLVRSFSDITVSRGALSFVNYQ